MEWRQVRGYEGLYEISDDGRIRRNGKILSPTDNGNGYLIIGLMKNNKKKNHYIHRLVAEAFVENPSNYEVVNHIDFDKRNNDKSNLEWCTQKMNIRHSSERMKKRRSYTKTNTGERYIYYRKSTHKYRLVISYKEYPSFDTLEEAVAYRDKLLRSEYEKIGNIG